MFIIGVTGGIGCGKSSVARICLEAGVPVIDADQLSHEVTAAGGAAIPAMIETFGTGVIDNQGALNREYMAKKVFQNHRALDQLSAIVHLASLSKCTWRSNLERKNRKRYLDVPIPVKNGFVDICDQISVVWANDENRLRRLAAPAWMNESRRRIAMQMTGREY